MDLSVQEYVKQMVNRYNVTACLQIFAIIIIHYNFWTYRISIKNVIFCLCEQVTIKYMGKSQCDQFIPIVSKVIFEILQKS